MSPGGTETARVDVALPLPIHRTFTYTCEGEPPPPGTRVRVPFQRAERIGWVVGPGSEETVRGLKPILSVLDERPTVTADILRLCRWMADYYAAPLGVALKAAVPAVLADASRDYIELAAGPAPLAGGRTDGLRPRERRVLDALAQRAGPQRVSALRDALGRGSRGSIWPEIRSLEARGAIVHTTVPPQEPAVKTRRVVRIARWLETLAERDDAFGRAGRQREAYELLEAAGGSMDLAHLIDVEGFGRAVLRGLLEKGLAETVEEEEIRDPFAETPVGPPQLFTPTRDQDAALATLRGALGTRSAPFLLQGVTGSGKTLVYVEVIREALARDRTAIVLVPEISLTPQTAFRFRAHFGDAVAVLHSRLSDGERYDAWRGLRRGDRRVAVGARSALFAPLENLGVIIVDEEHDGSYKQSEAPRYHARDLAVVRAQANDALCVLGSATPSLETWHNAATGKFTRISLPERVAGAVLPEVRVIDLRVQRAGAERARAAPPDRVLSEPLVAAISLRLRRGEQVILLHNRRGYSSFVQCRECGEVSPCLNCSVALTYHRTTRRLLCHHCRHEEPVPARCGRCGSADLSYRGLGTEQVERVTAETFPGARIARMDVDTTSGKCAHQQILERVERGEVDILLGTQMIAKGLDFPRVTLVGVVSADVGLHLPDFRASERTFQLLSQVAGRAGRGALGGEVIVQTSLPDHYAIRAAVAHDYEAFARRELEERRPARYPPWVRLLNAVISSPDRRLAASAAETAAAWVRRRLEAAAKRRSEPTAEVVGPAPSPIERLHGRWRWHFFVRSPAPRAVGEVARALAEELTLPAGDVRLAIDRDPVALL